MCLYKTKKLDNDIWELQNPVNLRINNIFETLIEQYLQKYEPKIN